MNDIELMIDEVPVFVQIIQPKLNFSIVTPPPLSVLLPGGSPVFIQQAAPPQINVQVVTPPPVQVTASMESGPPGPPGPPGPRGSLFLGGYPSFSNLPVPDGVNIKVGDFALVQDESAIYELE